MCFSGLDKYLHTECVWRGLGRRDRLPARCETSPSVNHDMLVKQGLIATRLSVLEALVIKVDENIHPWYYVAENIHPWLLQHMCTVDSVQCSVGVLKEPDRPGQI